MTGFFKSVGLTASLAFLVSSGAAAQPVPASQTQVLGVTESCNITQAFEDPYQAVTVRAASFAYPRSEESGLVRFLVATSYTSVTWTSDKFNFDNSPTKFWQISPQRFGEGPVLEAYNETVPANFASKMENGKLTARIAAVGLVPIYVAEGRQYCLVSQLKVIHEAADQSKKTIVVQLGTLPTSPVFATVEFEFIPAIKNPGN